MPLNAHMKVEEVIQSRNEARTKDEDEDADEVVEELSVYLNPALSPQLNLLQYPLHISTNASSSQQHPIVGARMKPRHELIEIDHLIPENIDGAQNSEFSQMANRTYQSTTIPVTTHLCLGKVISSPASGKDRAIHLVPLTHIRQMRPSFAHVDAKGPTSGDGFEGEMDDVVVIEDNTLDEQHQPAVVEVEKKPVVYQRKESERAQSMRKHSYSYMRNSHESEDWKVLHIHPEGTPQQRALLKMTETPTARSGMFHNPPDGENTAYAQTLTDRTKDPTLLPATGSEVDKVTTRIISVMTGSPTPYSLIQSAFGSVEDDDELLQALAVCTVMVAGNYCLNSRFMTGLSDAVKRARNLILLLLHSRGVVYRKRLSRATKVSQDTILVLLKQVAKKGENGWTLKVDEDTEHKRAFPLNVATHLNYWDRQMERYKDLLDVYDDNDNN